MPILCLEGPSAVGKSTIAAVLAAGGGAYVVPEVNALFARPDNEAPEWYFERQVERWALAVEAARTHEVVVLDGDPFQPLWYGWAYGFDGHAGLDAMEAFYRPRVARGELGFPDRYFVMGASEEVLRARRRADVARGRRSFEKHLRLIAPQRRYFEAMRKSDPGRVEFLESRDAQETARTIRARCADAGPATRPLDLLDSLTTWLRTS